MPSDLTPIEELDQNILTLCARINAATYELLVMIREFDERAGWVQWGLDNCTEWLAWRCDLSITTAREKVRVAHALKHLPLISEAFASGELSYSKVKAMTRVASRDNEQQLLEFGIIDRKPGCLTGHVRTVRFQRQAADRCDLFRTGEHQ